MAQAWAQNEAADREAAFLVSELDDLAVIFRVEQDRWLGGRGRAGVAQKAKNPMKSGSVLVLNVTSQTKDISFPTGWESVTVKDYYSRSGTIDTRYISADGELRVVMPPKAVRIYVAIGDVNEEELP